MLEQHEFERTDCFLCRPLSTLLVQVSTDAYTMAGLGPLCDGYAITSAIDHIEGLKSLDKSALKRYAEYAESVQRTLAQKFGNCVLTEHGNMPICNVHSDAHAQSHCYHPHFLMFPAKFDPMKSFWEYFCGPGRGFASLYEALVYGVSQKHYILVSPRIGRFEVFVPVDGLPRQLARGLVAESLGTEKLADWRSRPNFDWSLKNAALLREILPGFV